MLDPWMMVIDLAAIAVLVLVAYFPRHRRRDMVLAYIGLNVGVLAVASVLAGVSVGVGVGLGLFGVLSIVRLRSTEISQEEVAYYFGALAIGLICGLHPDPRWIAAALCGLIVAAFLITGLPVFQADYRQQLVILDQAYLDEASVVARLEAMLGVTVSRVVVQQIDLVRDLTVVDVRYRVPRRPPGEVPMAPPAPGRDALQTATTAGGTGER